MADPLHPVALQVAAAAPSAACDSRPATAGWAAVAAARAALDGQQWQEAAELASALLPAGAADRPDDLALQAQARLTLARARWHQADLVDCCHQALRSAELARRSGGSDGQAGEISAATLAAFALSELELQDHALPLALKALDLAQQAEHFRLLPVALSCAAHVHARLLDLLQSERLHMLALSHARERRDLAALQLAYDNLLLSMNHLHRMAQRRGDLATQQAVVQRAVAYTSHIRSLIEAADLDEWRRISLMQHLGELLGLTGRPAEALQLLQDSLARARRQDSAYLTLDAQTLLAELLQRQGQPEAALACLGDSLDSQAMGQAGYRRQHLGLQVARSCLLALGREAPAQELARRADTLQSRHEQLRQDMLGRLALAH